VLTLSTVPPGDCFVGGTVWALLARTAGDAEAAIPFGMAAAKFTVEWDGPVSPLISSRGVIAATTAKPGASSHQPARSAAGALWRDTHVLINTTTC
jgi:hypothetical protein